MAFEKFSFDFLSWVLSHFHLISPIFYSDNQPIVIQLSQYMPILHQSLISIILIQPHSSP